MKTPIAIHNLWHQGAKTLVSIGGVAFALLLVFMQLGFMGAVSHTATNVLEKLEFDILLRGHEYVHLYEPGQVDRKWLDVARSTRGVAAARPFWITIQNWRKMPNELETQRTDFESKYLPIAVMAFEPDDDVLGLPEVERQRQYLRRDDAVLLDDKTQADYGPWNGRCFSDIDVTRRTEIGGRDFRIDGLYSLGTGLAANGAVLMSHEGFGRVTPWDVRTSASLGLIEVVDRDPAAVQQVLERLRTRARSAEGIHGDPAEPESRGLGNAVRGWLGSDATAAPLGAIEVLSRQQAMDREKHRWLWQTPIGLIFQLGVLLSLIVGAAIVYMVLSTDVANRLPEYATLLAMGYSRNYLASIVMTQAVVLGGLGFFSAWGGAEILYRVTTMFSGIPLAMNPPRILLVAVLGWFMCCVSGLLALRKLWKAEPASLF